VDSNPVKRGAPDEEDTVAVGIQDGTGPRHVGPDEVPRDDVTVGPAAVDFDALRHNVALADVIDAPAVSADPVAGGSAVDLHASAQEERIVGGDHRLGHVAQGDGTR